LCATQGIAFGTPTACFLANIYLTPLDRKFDALSGLHYFRYADDLLLLAPSRGTIESALACFHAGLMDLQLHSKPSHEQNLFLSRAASTAEGFEPTMRIRHLGLEFLADGSVRLSRDKCRKICNLFRFAFRRKRAKLARIVDLHKRARFVIEVARQVLGQSVRNVAIIDYYLKHVSDEAQLRLLDRWLAEEVLSLSFGGGHKKSYFLWACPRWSIVGARFSTARLPRPFLCGNVTRRRRVPGRRLPGCTRNPRPPLLALKQWRIPPHRRAS
jgi:hypothetical protein